MGGEMERKRFERSGLKKSFCVKLIRSQEKDPRYLPVHFIPIFLNRKTTALKSLQTILQLNQPEVKTKWRQPTGQKFSSRTFELL